MNALILGNIFGLIGSLFLVGIGFIKTKKKTLIAQCFQCGFFALGNLVLGGYTGMVTNLVNIIRNLYSFWLPFNIPAKIVFILIQVVIGLKVNTLGAIGLLPIIACVLFTWFLDTKSDRTMKIIVMSTTLMWTFYDFVIKNYTAVAFDVSSIITNCVGMYRILASNKKSNN